MSNNYNAIVCRISSVHNVDRANTLAQARVLGFSVAVSKDVEPDTLGVFFPGGGQLSPQFCERNNLVFKGYDEKGVRIGGYFDESRRIRTQKFFGGKILSEGFWIPLNGGYFERGFNPPEGFTFNEVNGVPICNKYYSPATLRALANKERNAVKKASVHNFPEHTDTPQYKHVKDTIPENALVIIQEKLHGTSGRYGNVPVDVKLSLTQRFVNWLFKREVYPSTEYKHVVGSRRVVLGSEKDKGGGFYGTNDFRFTSVKDINLKKDEVIFFEIVGWVNESTPIMNPHDLTKLKDKTISSRFPDPKKMYYNYGCERGTNKIFVYRITQNGRDLPWFQVVERCKELGISCVPEIFRFVSEINNDREVFFWAEIEENSPSKLDSTHISEGIILRVEHEDCGIKFIKNKTFTFGVLEGYLNDDENNVDLEDAS